MYKGLIIILSFTLIALILGNNLHAQVYKIVDEDGNVTYTDEPPEPGAEQMELPEISVIETDYAVDPATSEEEGEAEEEVMTMADLRREYQDFRIIEPTANQTYWGTASSVVVSWGADVAYLPGMSVSVVVDGDTYEPAGGNLPLTLDRGEHQVYAILMDEQGRRIITSDVVTFHIKQASRLANPG